MSSRQKEISAESRRRLLLAAVSLLAERGPHGTSVQAVAELSGISRGSVSWHFGSKDGLVLAAVDHAFEIGEKRLRERLSEITDPTVSDLMQAHVQLVRTDLGNLFTRCLPAALDDGSSLRDLYVTGYDRIRRIYEELVASTMPAVDADAIPDLARALFGAVLGANVQFALDTRADSSAGLESLMRLIEDLAGGVGTTAQD